MSVLEILLVALAITSFVGACVSLFVAALHAEEQTASLLPPPFSHSHGLRVLEGFWIGTLKILTARRMMWLYRACMLTSIGTGLVCIAIQ